MQRTGELIRSLMADLGMEDGLRLYKINAGWDGLFRPPVSEHMSPVSLKGEELVINVDSPVWLQEISFYRTDIIGKLSAFGIKDIRLRLGRVRVNAPSNPKLKS